ncbi:hypothetical protein AALG46_04720, partial [Faecalibaculum rodentium]
KKPPVIHFNSEQREAFELDGFDSTLTLHQINGIPDFSAQSLSRDVSPMYTAEQSPFLFIRIRMF